MTDSAVFEGLTPPYKTIVADPPWAGYGGIKGNPDRHYSTMPLEAICALPVASLVARDAHLWLWGTNGRMEAAYEVVRAWGFEPKTLVCWCKPGPGVGYYLRNNTEHAIFAVRGEPMVPAQAALSTWFVSPRTVHSAKPQAFMDTVEQVSPGPYLELFARAPRLGWDSWGKGFETQKEAS